MRVVLTLLLVSVTIGSSLGRWSEKPCHKTGETCPVEMRHFEWEHPDQPAKPFDNRTHYHYFYEFNDHKHYVTLNYYAKGKGENGDNAGYLAFDPFLKKPQPISPEMQKFKFDLPEGSDVEEQYHYHYTYAYHDQLHFISGIEYENPWWEMPKWFEKDIAPVNFNLQFDAVEKKRLQVRLNAGQQLFTMPMTPEDLRKRTQHADAVKKVREEGPYIQIPMKMADGSYSHIKVPTDKTQLGVFTSAADNSTHKYYMNKQHTHTWYIPESVEKTVMKEQKFEKAALFDKTSKPPGNFTSDTEKIVVHYHIAQAAHLHNHMVHYAENSWLNYKPTKCLLNGNSLPIVMPGSRPHGDNSTTKYVESIFTDSHPEGAQLHYAKVYGTFDSQHKQQMFSNEQILTTTKEADAQLKWFSYDPAVQSTSKNHAHYNYLYARHTHNHTVLLRGDAPPRVISLMDTEFVETVGAAPEGVSWRTLYMITYVIVAFVVVSAMAFFRGDSSDKVYKAI